MLTGKKRKVISAGTSNLLDIPGILNLGRPRLKPAIFRIKVLSRVKLMKVRKCE